MKEKIITSLRGDIASINWSSISTILIKEAAKCDSYSSDIFYSLKAIEKCVTDGNSETFLLGFRDDGVDPKIIVKMKIDEGEDLSVYRRILELQIKVDNNSSMEMMLYDLSY